jgi:hypothetical protein
MGFLFKIMDVEEYAEVNGIKFVELFTPPFPQKQTENLKESSALHSPEEQTEKPVETVSEAKPSDTNFFIRGDDKHWRVGFGGKKCTLDHLDGISYIAALLERPQTHASDRELYQVMAGTLPDNAISEDAAIDQGLNIEINKQEINDPKAKKNYLKRYNELQSDLENAESDLEKEEIEKELNEIIQCINEKNFVDPNVKKAQVNITKRLNAAYGSIRDAGMKELAKHLQDNIKTDGAYGRVYVGPVNWKIITT